MHLYILYVFALNFLGLEIRVDVTMLESLYDLIATQDISCRGEIIFFLSLLVGKSKSSLHLEILNHDLGITKLFPLACLLVSSASSSWSFVCIRFYRLVWL